jgi:hypothetical protein
LFIEGSHTTKNTASVYVSEKFVAKVPVIGTKAFLALTSWVVRRQIEKNSMSCSEAQGAKASTASVPMAGIFVKIFSAM